MFFIHVPLSFTLFFSSYQSISLSTQNLISPLQPHGAIFLLVWQDWHCRAFAVVWNCFITGPQWFSLQLWGRIPSWPRPVLSVVDKVTTACTWRGCGCMQLNELQTREQFLFKVDRGHRLSNVLSIYLPTCLGNVEKSAYLFQSLGFWKYQLSQAWHFSKDELVPVQRDYRGGCMIYQPARWRDRYKESREKRPGLSHTPPLCLHGDGG